MNTDFSAIPTRHWRRLDDGRVQCDVCPRYCRLHEGQRGLCFVRGRDRNGIELYTYGRSSGFCVDPIEKKPLNHFLPGSAVLSFGTAGCNLACKFCQNWDMSKSREMDTLADAASPAELAATARRLGAIVSAFDVRPAVREQVQSLGATFIEAEAVSTAAEGAGAAHDADHHSGRAVTGHWGRLHAAG